MIRRNARTVGYIDCREPKLNEQSHGFFEAELTLEAAAQLALLLEQCAADGVRAWFTATMTSDNLKRLRVIRSKTPAYELGAADDYARGEVFRVTGGKKSVNINFSGIGAGLILDRLRSAVGRAKQFVLLRIRSSKRDLLEFIPDTEIVNAADVEAARLALSGEALAGAVWPADNFSDWDV